ncbi:hypothetical protein HPB50_003634 [Hyalomma asiaticum]|uniref:Uncharacterized protein n=1 Tax=Hyalomma asiaticum TaxID=266040 RepID=A0ACB7TEC9_HYAAI|nr:hypothetical protein HPB50_003634 [Hyalomma asiaticum]
MSVTPEHYTATLCQKDRERYEEKTRSCGLDPFTLRAGDCVSEVDLWPRVDSSDIHEFLVLRTSFITREQLKSRKALEGHNFVTSGWVREPWVKKVTADTVIVITQVNHSQSLNKPPVDVWFMGKSDGEVLAAHCTCMAGNGEACSHLAALLFYVEYGVRAREERSCTDGPNSWLPPLVKKLHTRPVAAMDLASSVMKKRRLDGEAKAVASQNLPPRPAAPAPTEEEWKKFFDSLIQSGHRPAVASTDPCYSDLYVPAVVITLTVPVPVLKKIKVTVREQVDQ